MKIGNDNSIIMLRIVFPIENFSITKGKEVLITV